MRLHLCVHFCGHTNTCGTKQEMRHSFCRCQINWENKRYDSSLLGLCVCVCVCAQVCVCLCADETGETWADFYSETYWRQWYLGVLCLCFLCVVCPLHTLLSDRQEGNCLEDLDRLQLGQKNPKSHDVNSSFFVNWKFNKHGWSFGI